MDDDPSASLLRKQFWIADDAVAEPRADREQQVAVAEGGVGLGGAVHAQVAQVKRVIGRDRALAHQSSGHRDLKRLCKGFQVVGSVPGDHAAAAGQQQRSLAFADRRVDLLAQRPGADTRRAVARVRLNRLNRSAYRAGQDVLGHIDQNRAGPPFCRQVPGFLEHRQQFIGFHDQVVVLGHRLRDSRDIRLLKGVRAGGLAGDRAGDRQDRHRIQVGVGQSRDQVGRPGTRRRQHDARQAGCLGIAFGRVGRALLVARQDAGKMKLMDRVKQDDDGAAGVAEGMLDALAQQKIDDRFSSVHGSVLLPVAPAGRRGCWHRPGARNGPGRR